MDDAHRNAVAARPARRGGALQRSDGRILAAARELFLADGYAGVNLDRVAAAAGVSRQTVYNRFGSKEAVLRATLERHWARLGTGELGAVAAADVADPRPFLRRLAMALIDFVEGTDQIAMIRLVIAESDRLPWIAEEFYRAGKEPLLRVIADRLARLTDRGALSCPDPVLAAHQFLGLLQEYVIWPRVMGIEAFADPRPSLDRVVDETIGTFLCRYGARP
ncbi:MAG: hypothetical protein QG608_697 [Actinomycetota bacterium]|nr:hypothetical protein [Actinomycetota bacterium]